MENQSATMGQNGIMRQDSNIMMFAMHLLLCLSVALWSLNNATGHDPAQVAKQTSVQIEIEDHGHSHGDTIDLLWSLHGHAHDAADHDHNSALTPAPVAMTVRNMFRQHGALPDAAAAPPPSFGFERPPRVLPL